MSAGRETAFVGIEYTLRQEGNREPKNYFVNLEIEQMSLHKYDARPHWGKNSIAIFEDMPSHFPMWSEFLEAKAELDPYDVFSNSFWRRASGEIPQVDSLKPGCNLSGECYCQEDSHCQTGTTCQRLNTRPLNKAILYMRIIPPLLFLWGSLLSLNSLATTLDDIHPHQPSSGVGFS
nr:D-arabinono-1,4-lactone oxidase [Vibrio alginolyticus]